MKGDTQKDRLLTEARAMVVRDYLVQNLRLNDTRVKTDSNESGVAVIVYVDETDRTKPANAITRSATSTRP